MKTVANSLFYLVTILYTQLLSEVVASCVDVEIICTSGEYPEEITWEIKQDDTVLISGVGGETKSACLPYGTLALVGKDCVVIRDFTIREEKKSKDDANSDQLFNFGLCSCALETHNRLSSFITTTTTGRYTTASWN